MLGMLVCQHASAKLLLTFDKVHLQHLGVILHQDFTLYLFLLHHDILGDGSKWRSLSWAWPLFALRRWWRRRLWRLRQVPKVEVLTTLILSSMMHWQASHLCWAGLSISFSIILFMAAIWWSLLNVCCSFDTRFHTAFGHAMHCLCMLSLSFPKQQPWTELSSHVHGWLHRPCMNAAMQQLTCDKCCSASKFMCATVMPASLLELDQVALTLTACMQDSNYAWWDIFHLTMSAPIQAEAKSWLTCYFTQRLPLQGTQLYPFWCTAFCSLQDAQTVHPCFARNLQTRWCFFHQGGFADHQWTS